jgi:hypothetical protein
MVLDVTSEQNRIMWVSYGYNEHPIESPENTRKRLRDSRDSEGRYLLQMAAV